MAESTYAITRRCTRHFRTHPFSFWEPVFFAEDNTFPSGSKEKAGHFVGIATNVGDALTFEIYDDDTKEVKACSAVRSRAPENPNLCAAPVGGEDDSKPFKVKPIMSFVRSSEEKEPPDPTTLVGPLMPDELIGRSFIMDANEEGESLRAQIVRKIEEIDEETN